MKLIQRNERGYAYMQFQGGSHNHVRTRLWIHEGCLTKKGEETTCPFPVWNAQIKKTEKGTFVMTPGSGTVFYADIVSGRHGSARITTLKTWLSGIWQHSPLQMLLQSQRRSFTVTFAPLFFGSGKTT